MANSASSVPWRSGLMVAAALTSISSSIDNNFLPQNSPGATEHTGHARRPLREIEARGKRAPSATARWLSGFQNA
ncbi:hypothetical protein D9M68_279070 [compost metagenome]